MPVDRCSTPHVLALLVFAAGALASCRDQPADFGPIGADATTNPTLCTRREDCGGRGICVSGVCEAVTPCQMDDQCAASGKICHQTRGYCVECDGRAGQCAAGQTCQFDFTCVDLTARDGGVGDGGSCSGNCTDRTMCGADQVCSNGACCPPPPRCTSPEQCPSTRPLCNGATGECFGGDSCTSDPDCASRPGCTGNRCFCDIPMGMATGDCRQRPDECASDTDCRDMAGMYNGRFCSLGSSPRVCAPAPNCTGDADCAGAGLVCDQTPGSPSNGRCVNGTPCPMGNECSATQACVGGVCVAKNCVNTPNFCPMGQTCNPQTGACMQGMSSCQRDTDCAAGNYCDTAINACAPGCRDSSDCGGNVCNAQHRCEGGGMGAHCDPCTTDADCPAGTSCHTNPFTQQMRCQENCLATMTCTVDSNAACVIVWCSCLGI